MCITIVFPHNAQSKLAQLTIEILPNVFQLCDFSVSGLFVFIASLSESFIVSNANDGRKNCHLISKVNVKSLGIFSFNYYQSYDECKILLQEKKQKRKELILCSELYWAAAPPPSSIEQGYM